jgi:hypothetical protein
MKTLALTLIALTLLSTPSFAQKGNRRRGSSAAANTTITPSGLKFTITRHGKGAQPHEGNVVIAHYTGMFLDGKVFDSSRERQQPFAFTLGKGQVIKGWDEAFSRLRVGDRATLVIPPELAYGDQQRGPIPANSTLVFDVELLDLKEHALSDLLERSIESNGIDSTVTLYHALKKQGFSGYYLGEAQINALGYRLLNNSKSREAVEVMKINAELYPESSNVYDSLGEAYMNNGDRELAITNYRKSLELDPKNSNATEMLRKLESNQTK